jgi:NADH dehydrogenase FAD-containing subunit
MTVSHAEKLRAIIAGGGVTALETAFALKDLASDQADVTVLATNAEFVYRPMTVTGSTSPRTSITHDIEGAVK